MLVVLIYAASAQLFAAINRSHPVVYDGTVSCLTPAVVPTDNDVAASQCREYCLASARSPLECQFMWVYDIDHDSSSAKGRCCPKTIFDPEGGWSDSTWTQDKGTFYRILGVDDNPEWPVLNMSTAGPACVSLGGSTKLCGSGSSGAVLAVQPETSSGTKGVRRPSE